MFAQYCRLNLHVSATWRDVVRATSKRFAKQHRFGRGARLVRHANMREMLRQHAKARELYKVATTGFFNG